MLKSQRCFDKGGKTGCSLGMANDGLDRANIDWMVGRLLVLLCCIVVVGVEGSIESFGFSKIASNRASAMGFDELERTSKLAGMIYIHKHI